MVSAQTRRSDARAARRRRVLGGIPTTNLQVLILLVKMRRRRLLRCPDSFSSRRRFCTNLSHSCPVRPPRPPTETPVSPQGSLRAPRRLPTTTTESGGVQASTSLPSQALSCSTEGAGQVGRFLPDQLAGFLMLCADMHRLGDPRGDAYLLGIHLDVCWVLEPPAMHRRSHHDDEATSTRDGGDQKEPDRDTDRDTEAEQGRISVRSREGQCLAAALLTAFGKVAEKSMHCARRLPSVQSCVRICSS